MEPIDGLAKTLNAYGAWGMVAVCLYVIGRLQARIDMLHVEWRKDTREYAATIIKMGERIAPLLSRRDERGIDP